MQPIWLRLPPPTAVAAVVFLAAAAAVVTTVVIGHSWNIDKVTEKSNAK